MPCLRNLKENLNLRAVARNGARLQVGHRGKHCVDYKDVQLAGVFWL